jgi:hypothetical protein
MTPKLQSQKSHRDTVTLPSAASSDHAALAQRELDRTAPVGFQKASVIGTHLSRFTGFFSPEYNTQTKRLGPGDRDPRTDLELEKQMTDERSQGTQWRRRKDWMKSYQDEFVKFAAVTRVKNSAAV